MPVRSLVVPSVVVALAVVLVSGAVSGGAALRPGSGGLETTRTQQTVTASFEYQSFCPTRPALGPCANLGGLTTAGPTPRILGDAEANFDALGSGPGANQLIEWNGSDPSWSAATNLSCVPTVTVASTGGTAAFVGCSNAAGTAGWVVGVDLTTGAAFANLSIPSGFPSMAFDPARDLLLIASPPRTLEAVAASNLTVERIVNTSAVLGGGLTDGQSALAFDPFSNTFLVPLASDAVDSLDPTTLAAVAHLPTNGPVNATAVDSDSRQVALAVGTSADTLELVDATDFAPTGAVAVGATCPSSGPPPAPSEILDDPVHGDLYALGFAGCVVAVNTSTDTVAGTLAGLADPFVSGAYVPATDAVWECSTPFSELPSGGILDLVHGQKVTVTSVLGLPWPLALLALAAVVGGAVGALLYGTRRTLGRRSTSREPR